MKTPLIRIENHSGDHQANQQSADDCRTKSCGSTGKSLYLHPENPVPNAVAQRSNQHYLLEDKHPERGEGVIVEKRVGNQGAQRPIDKNRPDAPAWACNRTRATAGAAKSLSWPLLGARRRWAFEP